RPDGVRSYTRPLMHKNVGEAKRTTGYTVRGGITHLRITGESAPLHPSHIRSLIGQAEAAGVGVWFETWGEWVPRHNPAMKDIPILPLMDDGMNGCFDDQGIFRINEGQWSRYDNLLGQEMF